MRRRARQIFPGSELPRIVARGKVVVYPPVQHEKGDVNARTIQMINAYDGWKENVGRVVVDSTWHHWFNMNLVGLEAAGGPNWDKISRCFVNVAKWIAPQGAYRALLVGGAPRALRLSGHRGVSQKGRGARAGQRFATSRPRCARACASSSNCRASIHA